MPKTSKERRMSAAATASEPGGAGAANPTPAPRPATDKGRLGALRSKKRGEAKSLMSRSPRVAPRPRKLD